MDASDLDPALKGPVEQIETARVYLEETASQLRDYLAGMEGDPGRLGEIEERLGLYYRLKRKYHLTVEELIALGDELQQRIHRLDHYEEEQKELEEAINQTRNSLYEAVKTLTKERKHTASQLESKMMKELTAVGMKETAFRVDMEPLRNGKGEATQDSVSIKGKRIGVSGMDRIEFVIRPNPGQDFKPLRRIASGGELSRIMLALRNVLRRSDRLPTLVFDEVDAGIGGAEAEAVGSRLKRLSSDFQVLCITHLPQIAVFGETHLKVNKSLDTNRTQFEIRQLDCGDREQEIARMLGGKRITPKTLAHAKEMLRRAGPVPEGEKQ